LAGFNEIFYTCLAFSKYGIMQMQPLKWVQHQKQIYQDHGACNALFWRHVYENYSLLFEHKIHGMEGIAAPPAELVDDPLLVQQQNPLGSQGNTKSNTILIKATICNAILNNFGLKWN